MPIVRREQTDTTFIQTFTAGDLTAGILSVNHQMNQEKVEVVVYTNLNERIFPDQITLIDADNLDVDLSSFSVLGTWSLLIKR